MAKLITVTGFNPDTSEKTMVFPVEETLIMETFPTGCNLLYKNKVHAVRESFDETVAAANSGSTEIIEAIIVKAGATSQPAGTRYGFPVNAISLIRYNAITGAQTLLIYNGQRYVVGASVDEITGEANAGAGGGASVNLPNLLIVATDAGGNLVDGVGNVISRTLNGFIIGSNTAIVVGDTILSAFGKTQGQINTRITLTSAITGYVSGTNTLLTDTDTLVAALGKVQGQITARALIASPTFTGTPAAPTAAPGTNTTQLATSAFVTAAIAAKTITGSSPPLDFPNVPANGSLDLGFTLTGAAIGDPVALGIPAAAQIGGVIFTPMVSNTNVITIRCFNFTAAPISVPSGTYKATVFK